MRRKARQGRLGPKAAFLFLAAAFAQGPAFPQDWGWGERRDRGSPSREDRNREHRGGEDRNREHREWEDRNREHERHGRNAYGFITYFYIDEIEREDGKIEIEFNSPVDPRTVSAENFLINGKPLPPNAPYKLSRKGNKIEIAEAPEWRGKAVSIEVVDLYSINGTVIETIPPIFLGDDEEYERDEDLEFVYWYWYDANGGRAFERGRR